ncbi:MAG: hypothetical protein M1402_05665 [Candidatus Thermoplasmatota archaeon]|nr:hypothetical protein [Candidatus Thermoplasmatota archaeon]
MTRRNLVIFAIIVATVVPATVIAGSMITGNFQIKGNDVSSVFYYAPGSNYTSSCSIIRWNPSLQTSDPAVVGQMKSAGSGSIMFRNEMLNGSIIVSQLNENVYELDELILTISSSALANGGVFNLSISNATCMGTSEMYISHPGSVITMQNISSQTAIDIKTGSHYSIDISAGSQTLTFYIGFLFPAGSYSHSNFQIESSLVS